MLNYAKSSAHT